MSEFDEEFHEKFENFLFSVSQGLDPESACWKNMLPPRTLIPILAEGLRVMNGELRETKKRKEYAELAMQFAQAKASAIARATSAVFNADDWKAQRNWLEANHPAQWGKFSGMETSNFKELER